MAEAAMILAAGRGTRLGALGLACPKVLVDVAGVPLLRRQLDYLAREGVTRAVVNVHHLAEQVDAFRDAYDGQVEVRLVHEPELLGTAGGVRNALEHLGDGPFFVLYGDVIVDEPLAELQARHIQSGACATLTVYASTEVLGKGTIEVDTADEITMFTEKATTSARESALVNAGLYMIDPSLMADLPRGVERDFGHDVFPNALRDGVRLKVHRLRRPVIDVGTPEALERARAAARASDRDGMPG